MKILKSIILIIVQIKKKLRTSKLNRAKSISQMHNNNIINKHSKPTKPFCDKLSNMP